MPLTMRMQRPEPALIRGAGAPRALRGQAEGKGANRTARPDHARGSSDLMCLPPLYAGHRGALCLNGQSVRSQPLPQVRSLGFIIDE